MLLLSSKKEIMNSDDKDTKIKIMDSDDKDRQ